MHRPPESGTPEDVSRERAATAPLNLVQLASLCAAPWGLEEYSPLGAHNYLLFTCPTSLPGETLELMANRLRRVPCPVIAVGTQVPAPLLRGVDVVVDSLQEAATLRCNINRHPLAAMTLVQLLRHNEECSSRQGLLAESLAYASLQGAATSRGAMASAPDDGDDEPVRIERHGDELHIALNRPDRRNAYSARMRDALYESLLVLQADQHLKRAVVRGEGSCFCIGGDLEEFGLVPDPSTAHLIRSVRNVCALLLELGPRLEFHLHRACIGAGIELPAFAGKVIARSDTFVQLPEIKMGLLPGAGGTVSILRRIGRHRTAYMALSARRIKAATAHEWGLIDELY